jgi:legumain
MHYDDIAHSPSNPHPGTVINIPGGDDVYRNVPKDYTGEDVSAKVFLSVLSVGLCRLNQVDP